MPSKATATLLPERCEPIRVVSDPGTRGATCRVAAFNTWLTTTVGVTGAGGGGAGAAVALTMTVAREIPAVKVLVLAVTCTVASLVPDGVSKTSQPLPP